MSPPLDSRDSVMRLIGKLRWLVLLLLCHAAVSDDTDIYLDGSGRGDPWVHVLLDLRGAHSPGGLCTYGIDCGPPFLSARAHGLLAEAYSPGDKVGAAGILRVILAAIIDNPRFDHINLSLLIPNHPGNPAGSASGGTGGGSLLAGYQRLGESRESLLQTLRAIPLDAVPPDHALQPRFQRVIDFAGLQGDTGSDFRPQGGGEAGARVERRPPGEANS